MSGSDAAPTPSADASVQGEPQLDDAGIPVLSDAQAEAELRAQAESQELVDEQRGEPVRERGGDTDQTGGPECYPEEGISHRCSRPAGHTQGPRMLPLRHRLDSAG